MSIISGRGWGTAIGAIFGRDATYNAGAILGFSRLQIAATQGWMDDVRRFVEAGDNINVINSKGHTALDDAIRERHRDIEEYLISKGAKRASDLH